MTGNLDVFSDGKVRLLMRFIEWPILNILFRLFQLIV